MMEASRVLGSAVALCLLLHAAPAAAGVVMVTERTDAQGTHEQKVFVGEDKLRIEMQTPGGGEQVMIYRQDKKVLWLYDDTNGKIYTEVTRQDLRRIKERIEETRRRLREQIKKAPPEERAMLEEMMRRQLPPPPGSTEMDFKQMTSNESVGRWTCDRYEGVREGQKRMEICVAQPRTLGMTDEDFEVIRGLADFFSELTRDMPFFLAPRGGGEGSAPSGLPVRSVAFDDEGQAVSEVTLKSVKSRPLDPGLFQVPRERQKRALASR
jgi:hypothetical protein